MLRELLGLGLAGLATTISLIWMARIRWIGITMVKPKVILWPATILGGLTQLGIRLMMSSGAIPFSWVMIGLVSTSMNALMLSLIALRLGGFRLYFGLRSLLSGALILGFVHAGFAYLFLSR